MDGNKHKTRSQPQNLLLMQEIMEAIYNSGGSGVWLRAQDAGQDNKESKCQQSRSPALTPNKFPNLRARVTSSVK